MMSFEVGQVRKYGEEEEDLIVIQQLVDGGGVDGGFIMYTEDEKPYIEYFSSGSRVVRLIGALVAVWSEDQIQRAMELGEAIYRSSKK